VSAFLRNGCPLSAGFSVRFRPYYTAEHERRWIEEYLRSQSGEHFEVEHVEKLTSE